MFGLSLPSSAGVALPHAHRTTVVMTNQRERDHRTLLPSSANLFILALLFAAWLDERCFSSPFPEPSAQSEPGLVLARVPSESQRILSVRSRCGVRVGPFPDRKVPSSSRPARRNELS